MEDNKELTIATMSKEEPEGKNPEPHPTDQDAAKSEPQTFRFHLPPKVKKLFLLHGEEEPKQRNHHASGFHDHDSGKSE
jgi:hypothetical protein